MGLLFLSHPCLEKHWSIIGGEHYCLEERLWDLCGWVEVGGWRKHWSSPSRHWVVCLGPNYYYYAHNIITLPQTTLLPYYPIIPHSSDN